MTNSITDKSVSKPVPAKKDIFESLLTRLNKAASIMAGADNTSYSGNTAPSRRLFHVLKVSMGQMSQTARLAACLYACYQHLSHPMPVIRQKVDSMNSYRSMK